MANPRHLRLLLAIALATPLTPCGDSVGSLSGPKGGGVRVPRGALQADTPLAVSLPPIGSNPALPGGNLVRAAASTAASFVAVVHLEIP